MTDREPRTSPAVDVLSDRVKQVLAIPHFWAIAFIMAGLILLYNAGYLGIERWFPLFAEVFRSKGIYAFVLSFLFLFPILYAGAVFRVRGVLGTWATFLVATLPQLLQDVHELAFWLGVGLFDLVALLLGLLIALDYNSAPVKAVSQPAKTVKHLSINRIVKVHEYERRHLARELHDRVIQSLLVVANRLHALEDDNHGNISQEAKKQMEEILVMLLRTVDDVRRLSYSLSPRILDNAGLLPALRWLAEQVSSQGDTKVEIKVNGREHRLPAELEPILFRIAQEALSNSVRHSRASLVVVALDFLSSDFRVTIEDNGCGFCPPKALEDYVSQGKLGLARIEQQVRLLGGTLDIHSEIGKGTILKIEVKAW